jgi:hypothetical protein
MFQKYRNFVQKHINFVQEYKNFDQENMKSSALVSQIVRLNNLKITSKTKPNFLSIFMVLLLHGANEIVYITNK